VLGLGGTLTLEGDLNLKDFTQINIKERKEFELGDNVKKYKILPTRSNSTYSIDKDGATTKLVVKDIDNFWKSKYLVIVVE